MAERSGFRDVAVYVIVLVGAGSIIAGALPKDRFLLDNTGGASWVRTSWWGLSEDISPVRLQSFAEWKKDAPYREPFDSSNLMWFVRHENGSWSPIDFDPW